MTKESETETRELDRTEHQKLMNTVSYPRSPLQSESVKRTGFQAVERERDVYVTTTSFFL